MELTWQCKLKRYCSAWQKCWVGGSGAKDVPRLTAASWCNRQFFADWLDTVHITYCSIKSTITSVCGRDPLGRKKRRPCAVFQSCIWACASLVSVLSSVVIGWSWYRAAHLYQFLYSSPTSAKFHGCSLSWTPLTVWLPNGTNGHARRIKPIGLHVRVLLLNIRVIYSLANPLKKISLRQSRGDSCWRHSGTIDRRWIMWPPLNHVF